MTVLLNSHKKCFAREIRRLFFLLHTLLTKGLILLIKNALILMDIVLLVILVHAYKYNFPISAENSSHLMKSLSP